MKLLGWELCTIIQDVFVLLLVRPHSATELPNQMLESLLGLFQDLAGFYSTVCPGYSSSGMHPLVGKPNRRWMRFRVQFESTWISVDDTPLLLEGHEYGLGNRGVSLTDIHKHVSKVRATLRVYWFYYSALLQKSANLARKQLTTIWLMNSSQMHVCMLAPIFAELYM